MTYEDVAQKVKKWFEFNFVNRDTAYFDFSDWDNEDELDDEIESESNYAESFIRSYLSHVITVAQLDKILDAIDDAKWARYLPAEHRVYVEEDEDYDEEEDNSADFSAALQQIRRDNERLKATVAELKSYLPAKIGHNNPPETVLPYDESDIHVIEIVINFIDSYEEGNDNFDRAKIDSAGKQIGDLANRLKKVAFDQSNEFLSGFSKSAGAEYGKWMGRGLAIVTMATFLEYFHLSFSSFMALVP